jgi:hypothetical protein
MRRFLLTAILTILGASGLVYAQPAESSRLSASFLQQRGNDMRRELIAEYRRLRASGLIMDRKEPPDVSALVARYFPAGISFEDALVILDAAGRRHRRNPPETGEFDPKAQGNLFVSIPMPVSIFEFGVGYKCTITLVPSAPRKLTTVGQVKARMLVDYL